MPFPRPRVPSLAAEWGDVDLGDARLSRRAARLAERLSEHPRESFPKALDDTVREAAYRGFGNDQVTPEAIVAAASSRAASAHEPPGRRRRGDRTSVDCDRARWAIEELFKALNTGCQLERWQLRRA